MQLSSLSITTGDKNSVVSITPEVAPDGKAVVILAFKKTAPGVHMDALMDGEPAVGIVLSDDGSGMNNAPWELGHLLAQKWEEAVKLAKLRQRS